MNSTALSLCLKKIQIIVACHNPNKPTPQSFGLVFPSLCLRKLAALTIKLRQYEKVATVTVSIKETVSLSQGERGPDRDSYFLNPVS